MCNILQEAKTMESEEDAGNTLLDVTDSQLDPTVCVFLHINDPALPLTIIIVIIGDIEDDCIEDQYWSSIQSLHYYYNLQYNLAGITTDEAKETRLAAPCLSQTPETFTL
jgi:hypothetical protein